MKLIISTVLIAMLALVLNSTEAKAYPEFIGYGYASCVTCHYNGLGGGPLNDYGRALWSAEIAAHPFYAKNKTDEEVANQSGFLGGTELPSWLRPHADYRSLNYVGSTAQQNQGIDLNQFTFYQMQADFGVTLPFDADQKYLASITYSYVPAVYGTPNNGLDRFLATEYYFRAQPIETWFVYAGLLEKAYGIRTADHESFQRAYQGFQIKNDNPEGVENSWGVIVQKVAEKWELALGGFFGNPYDDPAWQEKGASALFEFDVAEKKRFGIGVLTSNSLMNAKWEAEIHYKQQISKGSSLLAEYGIIQDDAPGSSAQVGSYNMTELQFNIRRGYNFVMNAERYAAIFNPNTGDKWIWSAGLLAWPIPRVELRTDLANQRNLSTSVLQTQDAWVLEGQIGVSL